MTSLRFSGQTSSSAPVIPKGSLGYRIAKQGFSLSGRVQDWTDEFVYSKAQARGFAKIKAKAVGVGGKLLSQLLDIFDYRAGEELSFKGRMARITTHPKGAVIFTLLFACIAARLHSAYQRGKKNNDFREIGDILRRDVTAISAFLFLLDPLTAALHKRRRDRGDGLAIVDRNTGNILKFSQLEKNYTIDHPEVLEAMIWEKNKYGLGKAMDTLSEYAKNGNLEPHVKPIQELVKTLIETPVHDEKQIAKLSRDIYAAMQAMEAERQEELAKLEKMGIGKSGKLPRHLRYLKNDVREVVARYAQARRLPVTVKGFLITLLCIGWFPIWFNDLWSRKKFAEAKARQAAASQASFNPQLTLQALKQQSRLAGNAFAAQRPV